MTTMTTTEVDAAFAAAVADLIAWGDGVRERLARERLEPRVAAEYVDGRGGREVRVSCPFCGREHYHGAASGGHRIAHCGRGGYVLVLAEPTTTTPPKGTRCATY